MEKNSKTLIKFALSNLQDSSKWSWIICNLPLKQFLNGENIIWSLQPSITLSHPSGEGPDPQIKILLDQEKSFQYTEELGWNWHKSWKLPTLSLQLDITDSEKGDTLLCPKDIYVHIFAVKALVDSNNKLCLTDVGLRGTNKMELVDGKVVFQTLKFASTSYNNEGVKFHLLMCIYLQISEDTKPKILKSIISPPIFVDSRKSVRDNDKLNENKLFLYIEPFYPDNFTRKFVKKETKKKESVEEEIQNTPDGLFSYLTAPNIRNKVKHPIFLCVRFSNCISLFFNPELVSEDDRENLTEFLQNLLLEDIEKGQEQADSKVQDSYFVLYINKNDIEDKLKKKKILELLCPIKYKSLSVVVNKAEIPPNFVQIQDLRWLMELYSKTYSKLLVKSKFCLRGEEDADDEDGPSDRIPPPERQTIGFTQEIPRTQNEWSKYFDTTAYEEDPQKRMKSEDSMSGPINMMEARTISYRESMSKLFPNGQDPASSANPMMNFPGAKANNPLLGNVFPGKGGVETSVGGMQQLPRGAAMGVGAMSGMNPAVQNLAAAGGRFPAPTGAGAGAGRGQNFGGMDPMMMLMMQQQQQKNKFNQLNQMNQMNMMGQMGQRGQQFPAGMANYQQMMRQFQPQMYDAGVKAETIGDASEINVKVAADEGEDYSEEARRNNRRGNDINVKDEESMG